MSIRPVDLQLSVNRAPEVNRTQSADNQRSEVMNQQFAARLQKETDQEDHQVMESGKSEQEGIRRDGKGNGQSARRDRKPDHKPEEKAKDKIIYDSDESMFDVKA